MNASSLVPDDRWEAIEPLLPDEPRKPKGGRLRFSDRAALAGMVFVLRTGCPWQTRTIAEVSGQAARRQGVRLLTRALCPPGSWHHATSCSPRHRFRRATQTAPLGGRTLACLAARLSPLRRALRAARDLLQGLLHLACALARLTFLLPLGGSLEIYDQCGVDRPSRRLPLPLE